MITISTLKRVNDEFKIEHVGSSLLNELAKGLYRPEAVLREYIQNAIDAHRLWEIETGSKPEFPIQLEFRGNGISILDYGIGMDEKEIRNVKSVAVSTKQNFETELGLTGHKGVGIWAGLSFFETLILRTSKMGDDKGFQITLHFKNILDSIDENTDIGTALNPNYEIYEYIEEMDEHYTDVTLENPTNSAEWFLNSNEVGDAIKRICPCKIHPNFVFQQEVENWYDQHQFDAFDITLDGEPVYRDYVGAVGDFTEETITINDMPVAQVWYAVSKKAMMKPVLGQLVGFRVIQNGFVIGGVNPYSSKNLPGFEPLSIGQYPDWYVGEIHVISPELRPDLARADFKESEIRRKFVQKIRKWYDYLAVQSMILGQKRKRLKSYSEFEKTIKTMVSSGEKAPFTLGDKDRKTLIRMRTALLEDEKISKQDKRTKSPKSAAPIDACRDKEVRNLRKVLLADIKRLLPHALNVENKQQTIEHLSVEESDKTPSKDKSPGDESSKSRIDAKIPSQTPSSSYIPTSFWQDIEQEDETTEPPKQVSIEVIFSLLEEILREEISEYPDIQKVIVDKLQTRITSVAING